jgi:hypothetical protein
VFFPASPRSPPSMFAIIAIGVSASNRRDGRRCGIGGKVNRTRAGRAGGGGGATPVLFPFCSRVLPGEPAQPARTLANHRYRRAGVKSACRKALWRCGKSEPDPGGSRGRRCGCWSLSSRASLLVSGAVGWYRLQVVQNSPPGREEYGADCVIVRRGRYLVIRNICFVWQIRLSVCF